jgi:hypothetical protein
MAGIQDYSTTANSNTSLYPEGVNPAVLNNRLRDMQVDVRNWYNDSQWIEYGAGSGAGDGTTANYTVAYVGATQFTISGDVSAAYNVERRIRATVNGGSYLYGTISAVSYSSPLTTVTVSWDSTTLTSGTLRIWLGDDTGTAATTAMSGGAFTGRPMSPKFLGPTETAQAISISGTAVTFSVSSGQYITITLSANLDTWNITWPAGVSSFTLQLTQDGTGGRTVTWPSAWIWPSGNEVEQTSTASAIDRYVIDSPDGGTTVFAAGVGQAWA